MPRIHDSSVLPRISTDLMNLTCPVVASLISTLMFRMRLLTFWTQPTATSPTPAALPSSILHCGQL